MTSRAPSKNDYVSEIDQFLAEFEQIHPAQNSPNKQYEQNKYARIAQLRDTTLPKNSDDLWQDF